MSRIDWRKDVVRRTMEGAHPYPSVQLEFLLKRLEACPASLPHIAGAIRDMAQWYEDHADALRDEVDRRTGANVAKLPAVRTEGEA